MKHAFALSSLVFCVSCASQPVRTLEPAEKSSAAIEQTDEIKAESVKPEKNSTTEMGRDVTARFYEGKLDPLYKRFSNRMRKALSLEQWNGVRDQIATQLGKETKVISENESTVGAYRVYRRQIEFEKTPGKIFDLTVSFGVDGIIEGFGIFETPVLETKNLEYKTKTDLRVPWTDTWFVFWGGRTIEQNYHAKAADQRFALDILAVDKSGKTHKSDGKSNSDYFAFGRDVVAPGKGTVVTAENGVDDNVPSVMNPKAPMGNHVVIDHGNGEFSFLAHFKKGTVTVKKGDVVKAGQKLGLCGNSGNSSEPHIHYHLQGSGDLFNGDGLPIQFRSVKVDGTKKTNVEIEKGQHVSP